MSLKNEDIILITDTSVLINFIYINRLDLLGLSQAKFYITNHVIAEITDDFPDQKKILDDAIKGNMIEVIIVN